MASCRLSFFSCLRLGAFLSLFSDTQPRRTGTFIVRLFSASNFVRKHFGMHLKTTFLACGELTWNWGNSHTQPTTVQKSIPARMYCDKGAASCGVRSSASDAGAPGSPVGRLPPSTCHHTTAALGLSRTWRARWANWGKFGFPRLEWSLAARRASGRMMPCSYASKGTARGPFHGAAVGSLFRYWNFFSICGTKVPRAQGTLESIACWP